MATIPHILIIKGSNCNEFVVNDITGVYNSVSNVNGWKYLVSEGRYAKTELIITVPNGTQYIIHDTLYPFGSFTITNELLTEIYNNPLPNVNEDCGCGEVLPPPTPCLPTQPTDNSCPKPIADLEDGCYVVEWRVYYYDINNNIDPNYVYTKEKYIVLCKLYSDYDKLLIDKLSSCGNCEVVDYCKMAYIKSSLDAISKGIICSCKCVNEAIKKISRLLQETKSC